VVDVDVLRDLGGVSDEQRVEGERERVGRTLRREVYSASAAERRCCS